MGLRRRGSAGRLAAAGVVALALAFPTAGAASSIVYVKDSNVWIANADGSGQYQVTLDGTPASPLSVRLPVRQRPDRRRPRREPARAAAERGRRAQHPDGGRQRRPGVRAGRGEDRPRGASQRVRVPGARRLHHDGRPLRRRRRDGSRPGWLQRPLVGFEHAAADDHRKPGIPERCRHRPVGLLVQLRPAQPAPVRVRRRSARRPGRGARQHGPHLRRHPDAARGACRPVRLRLLDLPMRHPGPERAVRQPDLGTRRLGARLGRSRRDLGLDGRLVPPGRLSQRRTARSAHSRRRRARLGPGRRQPRPTPANTTPATPTPTTYPTATRHHHRHHHPRRPPT